tara:strand:- start:453 stop:650 length:198 start_codon:yes stop_codon:yes gene_type:complete
MNCPECNNTLSTGTWVCRENDYIIMDSNNWPEVFSILPHNFDSNDEEIGSSTNIKYCFCGFKVGV